jgi:uncharacterized membrane protein HdeD (DUF308 family)
MTQTDFEDVPTPPFDRRWMLGLGVLSVIAGIVALLNPLIASLTVEALAGAGFLVVGVAQIWMALTRKETPIWSRWGSGLLGVLFILFSVALVVDPLAGLVSLTILVASFFLAFGLVRAVMAVRHSERAGWGWMLASGAVSMVLGVVIFLSLPGAALGILGLFLAVELLVSGIGSIGWAVASRRAEP